MNVTLPGSTEGHHTAAARLAEAIQEAVCASLGVDGGNLHDDAFDTVVGGRLAPDEVYWASAGFLADWRTDGDLLV